MKPLVHMEALGGRGQRWIRRTDAIVAARLEIDAAVAAHESQWRRYLESLLDGVMPGMCSLDTLQAMVANKIGMTETAVMRAAKMTDLCECGFDLSMHTDGPNGGEVDYGGERCPGFKRADAAQPAPGKETTP
jgi:hypothetical protein